MPNTYIKSVSTAHLQNSHKKNFTKSEILSGVYVRHSHIFQVCFRGSDEPVERNHLVRLRLKKKDRERQQSTRFSRICCPPTVSMPVLPATGDLACLALSLSNARHLLPSDMIITCPHTSSHAPRHSLPCSSPLRPQLLQHVPTSLPVQTCIADFENVPRPRKLCLPLLPSSSGPEPSSCHCRPSLKMLRPHFT